MSDHFLDSSFGMMRQFGESLVDSVLGILVSILTGYGLFKSVVKVRVIFDIDPDNLFTLSVGELAFLVLLGFIIWCFRILIGRHCAFEVGVRRMKVQ